MTTVKTEIFRLTNGGEVVFETMYAGNQNFVYRINGRFVTNEFWFYMKNETLPYMKNIIQVK